jgi:hypothetical protein
MALPLLLPLAGQRPTQCLGVRHAAATAPRAAWPLSLGDPAQLSLLRAHQRRLGEAAWRRRGWCERWGRGLVQRLGEAGQRALAPHARPAARRRAASRAGSLPSRRQRPTPQSCGAAPRAGTPGAVAPVLQAPCRRGLHAGCWPRQATTAGGRKAAPHRRGRLPACCRRLWHCCCCCRERHHQAHAPPQPAQLGLPLPRTPRLKSSRGQLPSVADTADSAPGPRTAAALRVGGCCGAWQAVRRPLRRLRRRAPRTACRREGAPEAGCGRLAAALRQLRAWCPAPHACTQTVRHGPLSEVRKRGQQESDDVI